MEIPSATPASTSTKTKSKKPAESEKTASGEKKPSATRRKKTLATDSSASAPEVRIVGEHLQQTAGADAHALFLMIATAAYYRAEQRSFAPGQDLDDWLEAERQVHASSQ